MRLPHKRRILYATASIAVLASLQASSDTKHEYAAVYDTQAFEAAWTGDYYIEPAAPDTDSFDTFSSKREHYLTSPAVGIETVELDDAGNPVPAVNEDPSGDLEPSVGPSPTPSPSPSFGPFWPFQYPNPWDQTKPTVIFPAPNPSPSVSRPLPSGPMHPQAFYYYDHGSLQNGTQLENEGPGFIKVFRDRDESIGGRAWGTRALIGAIRNSAADFSSRFPGRERIQVADIARKNGGKMSHGSHQNGLDADIIYIRKNRKEQPAFGGYGVNGFAEQFVVRVSSKRQTRDHLGKLTTIRTSTLAPSANLDVEATFELLRMFYREGNVKLYFMDKVLIREMFRYADSQNLSNDPETQAMLMKLTHAPSHADHFHVRLLCQDGDARCVSSNAPARVAHSSKKKERA
jgi:penicillin-insensitive murein endopeptidase